MSSNVDYFTKKEELSEEVEIQEVQETEKAELSEAVLKISYFTGKVKNNKTAEKLGIKIKVLGGGEGNAHIAMSGTEEALKKYASRFLGADKNDSLSQIQNDVGGPYFGESIDWTSKINDKVEEYIQEGSCSSKKKLHGSYNEEDSEYQEFFKKALEKFGVDSPDELSDEKKKEFFNYVDDNYSAKNEEFDAELLDIIAEMTDEEFDELLEDDDLQELSPELLKRYRSKAYKQYKKAGDAIDKSAANPNNRRSWDPEPTKRSKGALAKHQKVRNKRSRGIGSADKRDMARTGYQFKSPVRNNPKDFSLSKKSVSDIQKIKGYGRDQSGTNKIVSPGGQIRHVSNDELKAYQERGWKKSK